ncbi:hypothetical protein [Mycoplasma marinum]|uniref:Uncharacterized protein n=1 Tax=Mycoplasma marinum TaxID=1937190 RepID=A0A4R0XLS7_9MOLU|nr:hypothetical protein [Mycoplasma marinum]TCG10382.1 hypothetical protein C4B24_04705 [Mycoplasma marinum]
MSYLEEMESRVKTMISSGILFNIGDIPIKPRRDDLPQHYTKKESGPGLDQFRMQIIIDSNTIFQHEHDNCKDKRILIDIKQYKNNTKRMRVNILCRKSTFVFDKVEKRDGTHTYYLVTGFKLYEYKIKKFKSISLGETCVEDLNQVYWTLKNCV